MASRNGLFANRGVACHRAAELCRSRPLALGQASPTARPSSLAAAATVYNWWGQDAETEILTYGVDRSVGALEGRSVCFQELDI